MLFLTFIMFYFFPIQIPSCQTNPFREASTLICQSSNSVLIPFSIKHKNITLLHFGFLPQIPGHQKNFLNHPRQKQTNPFLEENTQLYHSTETVPTLFFFDFNFYLTLLFLFLMTGQNGKFFLSAKANLFRKYSSPIPYQT